MNIKFAALLAAAALSVAACEQQAATPQQASAVPAADTASATPADAPSAPPAAAPQTLTSSDNAVSISVTGNFQDQLGGNALPEGAEAGTILQQYDENTDITLTVVDAGKPAKPAKEYYANLKTALEQAGFASLKTGAATENRMDYSFTDAEGNNHNCINIYSPDNLYAVCAFSSSANNATLAETLKDVKLLKKAM